MKWGQIDTFGLIRQLGARGPWGPFWAKCVAFLWLVQRGKHFREFQDSLCSFLQLEDEGEQKGNAI